MILYGDCGHCPKCGRFCGKIMGTFDGFTEQLTKVEGICKIHGKVDLTSQSWGADDFDYYGQEEAKEEE